MDRWTHNWGQGVAEAACAAWSEQAPTDLSFKSDDVHDIAGESLAPKHLRMRPARPVTALPGFEEGAFWVQDLAASLPARLLGSGGGKTAFDLCAAPGGKAMQLASEGWNIVSVDNSEKRMERFRDNFKRIKLTAEIAIADLMTWQPDKRADAVLLDAPCSATGIFRRHPDVLHCIGPRQIADRAEVQKMLLDRMPLWVKPGGLFVYAVCSLEPEEGEHQIDAFLDNHKDFEIVPVSQSELPDGIQPTAEAMVRTLPDMLADKGHVDGFFIARMRRKS